MSGYLTLDKNLAVSVMEICRKQVRENLHVDNSILTDNSDNWMSEDTLGHSLWKCQKPFDLLTEQRNHTVHSYQTQRKVALSC